MDEERIRHIETEIVALRLVIQSMLIFLTEPKDGKAYDEALIGLMRRTLMRIAEEWDFDSSVDQGARRLQLEHSLTDLFASLEGGGA